MNFCTYIFTVSLLSKTYICIVSIITILLKGDFTETEIIVPDVITLKSDTAERKIRLEDCQNQTEIMEYLKICLSLSAVHYPEKRIGEFEISSKKMQQIPKLYNEIPESARISMA